MRPVDLLFPFSRQCGILGLGCLTAAAASVCWKSRSSKKKKSCVNGAKRRSLSMPLICPFCVLSVCCTRPASCLPQQRKLAIMEAERKAKLEREMHAKKKKQQEENLRRVLEEEKARRLQEEARKRQQEEEEERLLREQEEEEERQRRVQEAQRRAKERAEQIALNFDLWMKSMAGASDSELLPDEVPSALVTG